MILVLATAFAADVDVAALLDKVDDVARGEASRALITMAVKTDRYERTVTMEAWSQGTDKSLVVIREPAKEAGVATLMVDDQLWNYMPKLDRTVKLPTAMMSDGWMGSHVTNDDLVKSSRMAEDYDARLTEQPVDGTGSYVLELTPKPTAPVVWGRVEVEISADELPVATRYYDEDGRLERTMSWEDVRDFGGQRVPAVMLVTPAESDEYTRIEYVELEFDAEIDPATFTLQALRR